MSGPVRAATVAELLRESSATVVDGDGNARSCSEIAETGRRLAADFAAEGFRTGDRIAVQLPNGDLYLDLLAAAAFGGFVIMAVNLRFGDQLTASLVERSGARTTIRSREDLPRSTVAGDEADAEQQNQSALAGRRATDRFAIFTTSGTTSAPKLVVHQHHSVTIHAADVAHAFGYTPNTVLLLPMPLSGVFGFTTFWAAVAGSATIVLPSSFDADQTGRLIERHRVTSIHGSDDMFHRLLGTDHDLSSVRCAGYARFNSALDGIVERADERGLPLAGLYGMSEVQALFSFRGGMVGDPAPSVEQRWRAGGDLVSARAEYRVVDGELQLRGPSLFEGYLRDGGEHIDLELTAANYDDGWFRTGDLAVEEGPHCFEYVARMGDVMRLGGYLVAPAEVEATLMELPAIDQAQVVAVDRPSGARPVAFVILRQDDTLDEQAVIDHCRANLARFKCPIRVGEVQEFPVTDGPNGIKIQRAKLRAMGEGLLADSTNA